MKKVNLLSNVIQSVISFLLVFPIVMFLIVFIISRKVTGKSSKAFGHAADVTTFLLFFTVPIAIQSLFQIETRGSIVAMALIISAILTFLDWKSKNEIELLPLIKKIWRFLFLVLTLTYFAVWCLGLIVRLVKYLN
ncbi:DUF3397 domain-containing protein [Paenisporosarcina sp. TG-14]|uniref:DUF3397 domain-containing protein n=1 Tax=Paenisporosarcina sp. TG-14 TaxID=1231057 RepID=UPI000561513B|nr:DUF3397 domain-containing protein [Paenisporosarcina sp. TG-14]